MLTGHVVERAWPQHARPGELREGFFPLLLKRLGGKRGQSFMKSRLIIENILFCYFWCVRGLRITGDSETWIA
jgi:hypothetical protein